MNCYRCQSDVDLSLKRTLKSGHMLFVCRTCRREEYRQRKDKLAFAPVKDIWRSAENAKAWSAMAKEKNKQIMQKYASTNVRKIV